VIQTTGANDRSVRTANYWVCRKTEMPAVLVETGFLSNAAECANLTSDSYQQKLAQGIANGIVAFLNQYDPS
jgi:N-acetylmuramoyl-L-alanine amidase